MPNKNELISQLRELAKTEIPAPGAFKEKLSEWLEVLKEGFHDVDGQLEVAQSNPLIYSIALWPALRPLERTNMFNVVIQGDRASLLGKEHVEFKTSGELWITFSNFFHSSDFQSTLLEFKRRNLEPGYGALSTQFGSVYRTSDVSFNVPNEQVKLAAKQGSREFKVLLPEESPYYPSFSLEVKYVQLSINGFRFAIDTINRNIENESELVIKATRLE